MSVKAGRIVINLTAGTAQFVADMDAAERSTGKVGATATRTGAQLGEMGNAAGRTGKAFAEMGTHGVTGVQATSGALRVLEGNVQNNLRAAERFLANTLGLGPALQKIFPLVGGIALLGIFEHLITKVGDWHDAIKKAEAAPSRIADEFRKLNGATELSNDELQVTNDKLANEIAKLEGKPQNGLKLALDEAAVSADKLANSLRKDFEEIGKLLKEENIGAFKGFFLGEAPTTRIKKAFVGDDGFGGFEGQVQAEEDALKEKQRLIRQFVKDGAIDEKEAGKEDSEARAKSAENVKGILQQEADFANKDIQSVTSLQERHQSQLRSLGGYFTPDQRRGIALDKGLRRSALDRIDEIDRTAENEALEKKKAELEKKVSEKRVQDPFGNELARLDAQLRGVNAELEAAGKSESAKTQAKSWAEAQKAIEETNKSLREEKKNPLSLDQEVQIVSRFDQMGAIKEETAFRDAFTKGNAAIHERISLQNLLTDAVGKGYEAEKAARIEGQLVQSFGGAEKLDEARSTHPAQVEARTRALNAEDDAQRRAELAKTVDKLGDQIDLEKSLASAQEQGAEAVRLVTLAYKLREITQTNSVQRARELIKAEVDLNNAQEANKSGTKIAALNQDIAGIERLTAAEVHGAEAVRQAQLQNRIEEIKRTVPQEFQGAEIQKVTDQARAKRQQEITAEALKTGIAYQNHLESIDQEISALSRLKATQGDSLAIEISLHNLEKERVKAVSEQASVLGTARDGMRAFFSEMAADGKSAAQEVHTALSGAFSSLNDELAKVMSGQKSNWASLFQGISSQLAKLSLQRLESSIAAKFFPQTPAHSPIEAGMPHPNQGGWRGALAGIFGGGGKDAPPMSRNGQSPASALFVTSLGAAPVPQGPASVPLAGFRAAGGDVNADQPYVVGEEGQEVFIPDSDGTIIPNHKLRDLSAFNALKSSMSVTDISKPTPSQSWWSILEGALGGGKLKSHSGPSDNTPTWDPKTNREVYPDGSIGPVGATPGGSASPLSALGGPWGLALTGGSLLIGILSKIFGGPRNYHRNPGHPYDIPDWNFGGFRAAGGPVDPGSAYVVGENEPELFTPPEHGNITPLSKAGTGGNTIYYTIDARGTDPAQTEQRVRASIIAAHNSAINKSFRVQEEHVKRVPQTTR